ncbi:lipopolysaccharide biosynthesis protein [Halalkalibaculum sp. DA384]|uniref:lipopolysaccharide biosynthesis protein n=1 Tax=Halalkalibaculum sp. DA384 TaxID=3373606 RepID=UPI003754F70E
MKKLKELLSDTLVYGISSVLARFINYLLVPFHTDVFRPAQYGVVGLIYAAIAFLNVIFTFGMESAYLRYAKDRDKARDVFKTLQLGLLGIATILAFLLWLLSPWLMPLMSLDAGTETIYLMMIGILWFDTLSIVPFAELRLVRRSWLFATLRTGNVLINLGLNFFLILSLGWGIEAVFWANVVASGATTLVLWLLTADMLSGSWSHPVFRKALKFGLPFIPAGVGYAINEMLDRFFLNNYLSPDAVTALYGTGYTPEAVVGVYNACYKLAVFMLLLVQMFRMAWQPFFMRHSDDAQAPALFRDVFRYFNVAAGILFLSVALFVEEIVQIEIPVLNAYIIGKEYWMGLHIVPLLLGAYWFHGWYMNFSAGIFIEEETRILPKITLAGAAITVCANLVLIPFYGMLGSATATLLSYAAMALLLYHRSTKVYPVSYELGRAGLMIAVAALCLVMQPAMIQWAGSEWTANILLLLIGTFLLGLLGYRKGAAAIS